MGKIKDKLQNAVMKMAKVMGTQVHLRSLRDTFITLIPFLVISGLMIMVNNVIISPTSGVLMNVVKAETLVTYQEIGNRIVQGSMSILSLLVVVLMSFTLAQNKKFKNPLIASITSLGIVFVFMPLTAKLPLVETGELVEVSKGISLNLTSASGLFVSMIVGIFATELFMKLANNKKLQVNISGNIPPAVIEMFNNMFPIMITFIVFSLIAFFFTMIFKVEVFDLINTVIQKPLTGLATNLVGYSFLEILTHVFWMFGIHPSGFTGPAIVAPLTPLMVENTEAYAAGLEIPHIIQSNFRDIYLHIGGTGQTLGLVIATLLFSKRDEHKLLAKTTIPTTAFGINEPIIFGFPIMLNPFMFIPFVFGPIVTLLIAYYATLLGWVSKLVVFIPWSVPPLINVWLASGGDFRNVVLQLVLIIVMVVIYLPFLKIYEKSMPLMESGE